MGVLSARRSRDPIEVLRREIFISALAHLPNPSAALAPLLRLEIRRTVAAASQNCFAPEPPGVSRPLASPRSCCEI